MLRDFIEKAFLLALALATPFLLAHEAKAGDFWLDANVASYHISTHDYCYNGKCEDFNQLNYGLGVTYYMDDTIGFTGGFFKNSYSKTSAYAGIEFKKDFAFDKTTVSPVLMIGGVTGYQDTEVGGGPVRLMALPALSVSHGDYRAVVGYLPMKLVGTAHTDVLTFQLGYHFF